MHLPLLAPERLAGRAQARKRQVSQDLEAELKRCRPSFLKSRRGRPKTMGLYTQACMKLEMYAKREGHLLTMPSALEASRSP